MKLEELIRAYVSPIKRFDQTLGQNYQAEDIYNYYRNQVLAQHHEVESFMRMRFGRKFRDQVQSQDQLDYLNERAKEISSLAQQMFQTKFPQFYQS